MKKNADEAQGDHNEKELVIKSFKKEYKAPGLLGLEKRLPRPRMNSFQHYGKSAEKADWIYIEALSCQNL